MEIFDGSGEGCRLGHRGTALLAAFAARYAEQLAAAPAADQAHIRSGQVNIVFGHDDWSHGDVPTAGTRRKLTLQAGWLRP